MDDRYENEQLYHHGTKGMKWGRRRYQNEDGSLTALGRVHYGVGKARDGIGKAVKTGVQKHKAKVAAKKEEKRIEALMKKPIRKLSEAELKERTERANKESALKQVEDRNKQAAMSFLQKFGGKMLDGAVIPAAVDVGKKFLEKSITKMIGLDAPDLTNTFDILKKAGMDPNKLTDKQLEALGKRHDIIGKLNGKSEGGKKGNVLERLAAVGGDVTKLSDEDAKIIGTYAENVGKYEKWLEKRNGNGDGDDNGNTNQESKPDGNNKPESKPESKPDNGNKPASKPESKPDNGNKPTSKPNKGNKPSNENKPATTNTIKPSDSISSPDVQSAAARARVVLNDEYWERWLGIHT